MFFVLNNDRSIGRLILCNKVTAVRSDINLFIDICQRKAEDVIQILEILCLGKLVGEVVLLMLPEFPDINFFQFSDCCHYYSPISHKQFNPSA